MQAARLRNTPTRQKQYFQENLTRNSDNVGDEHEIVGEEISVFLYFARLDRLDPVRQLDIFKLTTAP
jgi:hypothetical protein